MSRNRELKEARVAEIKEKLERAPAAVLADFRGLTVADDTELRRRLRAAGVEYSVVKNTLLGLAAKQAGITGLEPHLEGPTAIAFSFSDATAAARELSAFAKDHQQLQIKAGILEGRVVSAAEVKALADLPPREVLLAKVLAGIQAPLTQLAVVLAAPLRGFVTAANALREQRAAAG
ncbi:MAG: 50S ribosomal protein L10 [Clostridia bacterium]|nr:50S ribosomal protein L10 [Clostridia bacterium]